MKKFFYSLVCIVIPFGTVPAPEQCPEKMPPAVEQKLLPVIDALNEAVLKGDIWDKNYQNSFETLLKAKDTASKQARVALMDYNIGEELGEELSCAVVLDGNDMVKLLNLYNRCYIRPLSSSV